MGEFREMLGRQAHVAIGSWVCKNEVALKIDRTNLSVRRGKARSPSGRQTHPATFAPAGSNRSSRGGNESAEAFDGKGHVGDPASPQAATCSESRAGLEVRRGKARSPSGRQTHPATFAPAGSNRSSRGGDETAEAFDGKGHVGDPASPQ